MLNFTGPANNRAFVFKTIPMPNKTIQRVVTIEATVVIPHEYAGYTDEEINNVLIIKSPDGKIKVTSHVASDE